MLIKISRFNKFSEVNNLTRMELYNMAIIRLGDTIDLVNRYIYDNVNVDLVKLFTNLSYDTGVSISLGRGIKYVRKMQERQRKNCKRTY